MKKLIVFLMIQNFVIGQIKVPSDGLDLFNNMMRYLFDNCRSEFGSLGFWRNDRVFLADDELDFVVFNEIGLSNKEPTRRIKSLVKVVDESVQRNWTSLNLYTTNITLEIETVFIFDKDGEKYQNMAKVFYEFQKLFKNSKIYYCSHSKDKITVKTFNAFATFAPPIWILLGATTNSFEINWFFFEIEYNKKSKFNYSSELCENFFFDRTDKLDSYMITTGAKLVEYYEPELLRTDEVVRKDTNLSRTADVVHPLEGLFAKCLADYLDVVVKFSYGFPIAPTLDPIPLIIDGTIDIFLTPKDYSSSIMSKLYTPYPRFFFYDVILTHNRGLMSPLEKMFEFYGWLTIIATFIILFFTFIVIYCANKTKKTLRFSFSVFECLKLLINNSIDTRMDSDKIRIFFSVIFLYFLVIQATFSGNLAAFLTKPVYRKNVEALEDLKNPIYTKIHAPYAAKNYIEDPELLEKIIFGDYRCVDYIHDPKIGCIDQESTAIELMAKYDLEKPKNPVKFNFASPIMHHNWALKYKINNLILRLAQSGIEDFWARNHRKSSEKKLKQMKDLAEDYHRPIEVKDVLFAFVLLATGLFFAFLCYIVEYLIKLLK